MVPKIGDQTAVYQEKGAARPLEASAASVEEAHKTACKPFCSRPESLPSLCTLGRF